MYQKSLRRKRFKAVDPDLKILQGRELGNRTEAAARLAARMAGTYFMRNDFAFREWLVTREYGDDTVKSLRNEWWQVKRRLREAKTPAT